MYAVSGDDALEALTGVPVCDAGAPDPVVVADERDAVIAYFGRANVLNWDTGKPEDLGEEDVVILRFSGVSSMLFGSPNDEALHGHPLAGRGLSAYAAYRVLNSSWIAALERMNRVHSLHSPERFSRLHHFVLTFHDSTFECVCANEPQVSIRTGTGETPQVAAIAALQG